jgi:ATP synthase protein I
MLKHFQNQRHRSVKLLALQALAAVLIASAWSLMDSPAQGVAFLIGALAVALGQFVQAIVAFTGGVRAAAAWFGRFLWGVMLKWLVVFVLMFYGMQWIAPAPFAALAGLVFSLLVIQLFNYFDAKVKRGS